MPKALVLLSARRPKQLVDMKLLVLLIPCIKYATVHQVLCGSCDIPLFVPRTTSPFAFSRRSKLANVTEKPVSDICPDFAVPPPPDLKAKIELTARPPRVFVWS
jgi:hypothetical protein